MLPNIQAWDRLGKRSPEIGVFFAPIPSPPTGVDAQLHEICEASDLKGAWCCAARQIAEPVQIDWLVTLRFEVGTEKCYVAYFIIGVIRDVLRHVTIELLKGSDIGLTRSTGRSDASELVILLPQVSPPRRSIAFSPVADHCVPSL
jgi:hypothetical protein